MYNKYNEMWGRRFHSGENSIRQDLQSSQGKCLNSKSLIIQFKQLKEKVAELSGIPINKQIIVANVQIVKDDALLLESFIAENSSFILATKL